MYSVPVQVSRTRLQLSQKLWVIGVMKPTRRPVSAHVEVARRAAGPVVGVLQRPAPAQAGAHDRQRQILVGPVAGDVAHRHGLDQAEVEAVLAAPGEHAVELVLVHALHRHGVDLDRQAGGLGGEDAVQRLLDLAPAGDRGELRPGSSVSSDTLIRRTPAAYSRPPCFASCVPLVVTVSSFSPPSPSRAPRLRNRVITSRRTSGSPPVMRILLVPRRMKAAQSRSSSSSVSSSRFGRKRHVLRHAVDAAEIAAVGDGDAQVGDWAAERIDHGDYDHACLPILPDVRHSRRGFMPQANPESADRRCDHSAIESRPVLTLRHARKSCVKLIRHTRCEFLADEGIACTSA